MLLLLRERRNTYVHPALKGPNLSLPHQVYNLKDPRGFNERISIDGFERTSQKGLKTSLTKQLGSTWACELNEISKSTIRSQKSLWFQWAGYPAQIVHDEGGEFMTQEWKDLLCQNGIRPILTAAPWQRGRVEKHGGEWNCQRNVESDRPR